jgi:hypothetical protein
MYACDDGQRYFGKGFADGSGRAAAVMVVSIYINGTVLWLKKHKIGNAGLWI